MLMVAASLPRRRAAEAAAGESAGRWPEGALTHAAPRPWLCSQSHHLLINPKSEKANSDHSAEFSRVITVLYLTFFSRSLPQLISIIFRVPFPNGKKGIIIYRFVSCICLTVRMSQPQPLYSKSIRSKVILGRKIMFFNLHSMNFIWKWIAHSINFMLEKCTYCSFYFIANLKHECSYLHNTELFMSEYYSLVAIFYIIIIFNFIAFKAPK